MAKKKAQKKKSDEQDIGIDFSKIKKKFTGKNAVFKRYLPVITIVAFILISIFFSIHFRLYPATLPKADDMAENSVKRMIQNNVKSQVRANYPNLPESEVKKIINKQVSAVLQQNKIQMRNRQVRIDQLIEQQANQLKQQLRHEDGHTYLLAIDPYYQYRHTKNYLEDGNEWGAEKDGKYYDPLVLAGTPEEKRSLKSEAVAGLHIYVSAWTYKVMNAFNGNITLMQAMFWVPVIISSLCVIPAFFIGRKFMGDFSGLMSAMLIAVHPAVISRTAAGFADTDAYNILFPLLSAWFLLEALDAKDAKQASIWSALTGVALGLFAFAWQGWYFMLLFLFATSVGYIAYKIIIHRHGEYDFGKALKTKQVQLASIVTGVFLASTVLFVTIFTSFKEFMKVFSIFSFTQIKVVGISKIWPNVYTTVAELNPAKLTQALSQASMGLNILLLLAFVGVSLPLVFFESKKKETSWLGWVFLIFTIFWGFFLLGISSIMKHGHVAFAVLLTLPAAVYGFYNAYQKEDIPIHYTLLLLIWFAGTIYATSKGMRFIILMVPAFSIAGGIAIGKLIDPLTKLGELLELKAIYLRIPAAVIIFLLLFMPFIPENAYSKADTKAQQRIPQMNDDWYTTLNKIKQDSEKDAIINSWWDFGHWFAAIAERPVTLDGGRQNSPQAHWLGKLMLTSSEKESVGILRYLDCGANTGYNELLKYNNDSDLPRYNTIQQIYSTLPVQKDEAKEILVNKGIRETNAEDVLQYTHCNPPENYFITSGDMVGKSGVWAHFGSWDFRRATMFNKVHNNDKDEALRILQEEFGFSEDDAKNKYHEIMTANADNWISPKPGYVGTANCNRDNNTIKCNNGITFNIKTEEIENIQNRGYPEEVAYIKDGEFKTKTYDSNLMELQNRNQAHDSYLGVAFVPQGENNYKIVMMDSRLTSSMFTRLFYFENSDGGLEHFEKFHKTRDVLGRKIIVWKIDWDGGNQTEASFDVK